MIITMKMMVFSDFHGSTHLLSLLGKKIEEISPDVVIFCGDIVKGHKRGDEWLRACEEGRTPRKTREIKKEEKEDLRFYETFFSSLENVSPRVYVVPGNMDAPESRFLRACPPHMALHCALAGVPVTPRESGTSQNKSIRLTGCGGELTEDKEETTFVLQFPRKKVIDMLKDFSQLHLHIVVTHSPPVSSLSFEDSQEKGSHVVNDLIDLLHPDYLLCGHAHNAQGFEWIKNTLVVNPGALKYGNYAVVEKDSVEFKRL